MTTSTAMVCATKALSATTGLGQYCSGEGCGWCQQTGGDLFAIGEKRAPIARAIARD